MNNHIESILRGGQFKKLVENALLKIKSSTNLKRVEIEVLFFLARAKEQNTMKDICNHLQMNKGHISTALYSLTKQGYVEQHHDTRDRRYMHYTLTQKADDIVNQMREVWENLSCRLLAGLTTEDIKKFEEVSEKIGKNIEKMLEEEK